MTQSHHHEIISQEHDANIKGVGSKRASSETLFNLLENHHLHSTAKPDSLFFDEDVWQKCIDQANVFAMALKLGRVRGIAGIFAHTDVELNQNSTYVQLTRELIQGDILVILSGRTTAALEKAGVKEAEYAGDGLKEFCENLNISPILDMGGLQDLSLLQDFYALLGQHAGSNTSAVPAGAFIHGLRSETADHVSLYDITGEGISFPEVNLTSAAGAIDEHIHEKRLALDWCDRYHCSIFS